MTCPQNHLPDATWNIDLIWKYLHEEATPGKAVSHYNLMDPAGELDDRHKVYTMLVDGGEQTNPSDNTKRDQSMLPWNQLHKGIVDKFKTKYACGSVVKIAFQKYMGWGKSDPTERKVGQRGFDAVEFIVRNLLNGKPVRARVASSRFGHHFVGIVGARVLAHSAAKSRNEWEFLYLEPWGFNSAPITYAGATTSFLGIIREQGNKLKYGSDDVNTVGGHVS